MSRRTAPLLALSALSTLALAGCRMPPSTQTQTLSPAATSTGTGAAEQPFFRSPFPPETLAVHPLTRITQTDSGQPPRIEAHFELADRFGHGVKSLGTASVELRLADDASDGAAGGPRQLRRWTIEMLTPEEASRPYDRVTRTYRLTLVDLPAPLPPEENLVIAVRFTTAEGKRISGERRLGELR